MGHNTSDTGDQEEESGHPAKMWLVPILMERSRGVCGIGGIPDERVDLVPGVGVEEVVVRGLEEPRELHVVLVLRLALGGAAGLRAVGLAHRDLHRRSRGRLSRRDGGGQGTGAEWWMLRRESVGVRGCCTCVSVAMSSTMR